MGVVRIRTAGAEASVRGLRGPLPVSIKMNNGCGRSLFVTGRLWAFVAPGFPRDA